MAAPAVIFFPRLLSPSICWRSSPILKVLFVGTERGIEARVLPELGLPLATVDISGFIGKGWRGKAALLPQLVRSLLQSRRILDRFRPDVVVGVGGYASAPMLMAARMLRYPCLIHEQNAWPGLTNRLLARWVDRVCLSFAEADSAFHRGRTVLTGNPLRQGMEECPPVTAGNPQLLVFGGSRGARAINDAVIAMLPLLTELRGRLTIRHQTGAEDLERVRQGYREAGWETDGHHPVHCRYGRRLRRSASGSLPGRGDDNCRTDRLRPAGDSDSLSACGRGPSKHQCPRLGATRRRIDAAAIGSEGGDADAPDRRSGQRPGTAAAHGRYRPCPRPARRGRSAFCGSAGQIAKRSF